MSATRPHKPVKIAGGTYPFVWRGDLVEDKNRLAEIDYVERMIFVDSSMKKVTRLHEVLLHELLHGMSHEYGMALTEEQVASLSSALEQVLPQLDWITWK